MLDIYCNTGDPRLDEMGEIIIRNAAGERADFPRIVLSYSAENARDGDILILLYRGETPPAFTASRGAPLRCPYSIAELERLVRALLSDSKGETPEPSEDVDAAVRDSFDEPLVEGRRVSLGDVTVQLTGKEAEVFAILYENRGKPVSRERLSNEVWGGEMKTNLCDVYVCRLRTALRPIFGKGFLVNLRKDGYMMV